MANMSYCRFQNTLSDLRDCYAHLYDGLDDSDKEDKLSDSESSARKRLIELCRRIADEAEGME